MGCATHRQKLTPLLACKTVNGVLKVTIQQANIIKPPSKIFSLDPYLKITMSNQQFQGYIHKKAGRSDLFNESFEFIINSCYKSSGRSICIELWNKHLLNDKVIGMSIIDIDPIISFDDKAMMGSKLINITKENQSNQQNELVFGQQMRKSQCKLKVFLNHGVEQVGYLNTLFEFIEQPVIVVGFKFMYASLKRTSSIFTTMHCSVQIIAGQQILSTHKQKDKDTKNPPSWENQMIMLNIPKSLKECIIRVLDDQKEVGKIKFSLVEVINKKGQHFFTQQLQHEQTISGVIKFGVMVGLQSVIEQSKKSSRKIEQIKTQISHNQGQNKSINQMKRQIPSQKSTKMQESQFRQYEHIQQNEEYDTKIHHRPQDSNIVINNQLIRT